MRNIMRAQRGISLIELLVAIVIFAILFLVIDSVFISAHRSSRKAELTAEVDQNARIAIERLTREIRESQVSDIDIMPSVGVIFKSARPSDASSSFCLKWTTDSEPLADANADCKDEAFPRDGSYEPAWLRWVAYYFDDTTTPECQIGTGKSGGCIRRRVFPIDEAPAFTGGQVIATSIEELEVSISGLSSPATFSVTIKAKGQETVQGSPVPPQEILLNGTTLIRN